jgi:hypothetical protein
VPTSKKPNTKRNTMRSSSGYRAISTADIATAACAQRMAAERGMPELA